MSNKTNMIEGPVSAALRIAGVSVVCHVHEGGDVEFGYPLTPSHHVRRSTGVVREDGTFHPPTCDTWVVLSDGTTQPVTWESVRTWSPEIAWKYRMRHVRTTRVGSRWIMVFEVPCGTYAVFAATTPSGKAGDGWRPDWVAFSTNREDAFIAADTQAATERVRADAERKTARAYGRAVRAAREAKRAVH